MAATNATYTESAMSFMLPVRPTELSRLKQRGAKVMVYHGVSDAIFSIDDTVAWYDGVQRNNGGDASDFARVYAVPGMAHCVGGPATEQFDMLTALGRARERSVPNTLDADRLPRQQRAGLKRWLPSTTAWTCCR